MRQFSYLLLCLMTIFLTFNIRAANMFYYAGSDKYTLTLIPNKRAILRDAITMNGNENYIERTGARLRIIDVNRNQTENTINVLKLETGELSLPIFSANNGMEVVLLPEIVLKPTDPLLDMASISKKYHMTLSRSSRLYQIYSVPTNSDVISIANELFETGEYDFAYPNLFCPIDKFAHIPNDQYFSMQIDCHNTGQVMYNGHTGTPDADINAPEAWDITRGTWNIIVAVIDEGITLDHPDLPLWRQQRLMGSNFGSGDTNNPSPTGNDNHGNACAGVIGATMDNNEGIAGIAPQCRIMPVRVDNTSSPNDVADAILFAMDNGANVISCSLGYSNSDGATNLYPVIKNAIDTAIAHGVVVLFAAGNTANHVGNDDGYVTFPANVENPYLITVGASDRYDSIANYSPKSELIDVVAPSHRAYATQISGETFEMWSIDIPGPYGYNPIPYFMEDGVLWEGIELPRAGMNYRAYTGCFGGTSHACPVVAGVVALMLSVNPNLTPAEVCDVLKKTSAQVGGYTYTNGKSEEMGYGRVDAYAAVLAAITLSHLSQIEIEGGTYACDSSYYYVRNVPEGATIQWSIGRSYFSALRYKIEGDNHRDSVLLVYDMPIKDLIGDTIRGHISPHEPFVPISINDTTVELSVRVSKDGLSYTKRKTLYSPNMGTPLVLPSDTSNHWVRNTERTFTVTNCFEAQDSSLLWTVSRMTNLGPLPIYQTTGRAMSYTPTIVADYDISVTNTEKTCGSASWNEEYVVVPIQMKGVRKQNEDTAIKVLRDGQLYIRREGKTYRLDGSITTCQ